MERPVTQRSDKILAALTRCLPEPAAPHWDGGDLMIAGRRVPVVADVVRFRRDDGYNASFALQWKAFSRNQIDDENGTRLTAARFAESTKWPLAGLEGALVLEAGCGPGRFTRILAGSGADLVSFDYSTAVDSNIENNGRFANVTFLQADILDMPFRDGAFDRVFCHGVLQHTPAPERAFHALNRVLKPGGHLSFDVYLKDGKIRPWKSKYLWRPLTTRMRPEHLLACLRWFIPKWLPIDTAIKRLPRIGPYLGSVIPCWNYYFTDLSPEQKVQWAIMDTFDALAPPFDLPVTLAQVEGWFRAAGYTDYQVFEGGNGVVGNGIKPA
ncbi:MAG: methyltransferase domain-containing protein [Candidatus Hydrogenedens sp.]|nr:methyltransferase domain-containing protein [Candidatus Hydrogenedens sp.]